MENPAGKIKIFGEHDAATTKQIETCIVAGGERGVLCAYPEWLIMLIGVLAVKSKAKTYVTNGVSLLHTR